MDWLAFSYIVFTGFTACAEFGSFLFVHPVLRKLPPKYHILVEKGLVKTFGRFMPFAMTICMIISISYAIQLWPLGGVAATLAVLAALSSSVAVISTIIFNVPRNSSVSKWDADALPSDWKRQRTIWEVFQGVRASLLLIGFVLLTAAVLLYS